MGGASYEVCGAQLMEGGRVSRCYRRGHACFGGRCREHDEIGQDPGPRILCGWKRSDHAVPCANPVRYLGQRCKSHAPDRTEAMDERRRFEIEGKLAYKLERYRAMERDIGELRAELARLVARAGGLDLDKLQDEGERLRRQCREAAE